MKNQKEIINEIELDFKNAIKGIAWLPKIFALQFTLHTGIIISYLKT